jgi:hypothetical protein
MPTETSANISPYPEADDPLTGFGHPRGTLAIVIAMAVLFALGWLGMYFFMFLKRGGLHP